MKREREMAISLPELKTAVETYLHDNVKVEITDLKPRSGSSIQPNETFTFNVTVTNPNPSTAIPGIRLVNVRYHVKVEETHPFAKLVVPATNPDFNGIRYRGPRGAAAPGALVDLDPKAEVDEMYLFPPASGSTSIDRAGDLDVGDSDTISVTGKGGSVGNTNIVCSIIADPDLDYLFPKNRESLPDTEPVVITT
jgi:hypothetical protein